MPLSYDTVAAVLASHTADQAFPLPPLPITRDNGILMYRVAEAVAHAFLGEGNGQPPLLPGASAGAQHFAKDVIANAEPAIRRLEGLAPHVKAFKGVAEEAFLSTFGGPDGHENRRPLIKLLFNAEGEQACYNFIKNVVTRMLHASSELNSVDKRLFIGFRDFHLNSSTAWLRAKTLLAARDYARGRVKGPLCLPTRSRDLQREPPFGDG
ncbi:hypothetical protein BCR35DRAFT_305498 [Leucosporidium creatinivorum]|uniref:Uncharacterized protein n=1 Tax=Leucosporidium creatinivorum TaxID=106004 RepID=A0A1Y2F139_9BASI|nr:hypothetical protein BCR35DRAFT_305498 [Leucosporidium creatinivorum]